MNTPLLTPSPRQEALLNDSECESGDEEDSGRGKLLRHPASEDSGKIVQQSISIVEFCFAASPF